MKQISYGAVLRPLHDALIEDSLDKAEKYVRQSFRKLMDMVGKSDEMVSRYTCFKPQRLREFAIHSDTTEYHSIGSPDRFPFKRTSFITI